MHGPQPVNPKLPRLWHGGDYNPDQWPDEVRREDVRLMQLAGVNVASVGIFSWSQLEPEEGRQDWAWLDETMDRLEEAGVRVALATPSAAWPRWLTARYPEVMAAGPDGRRLRHGARVRFCPTSPDYRREVARIDRALAERYGDHPALVLWHVSNEYWHRCWCDRCVARWRRWLRARYGALDCLNHAWWTAFWSHRFSDWCEIIPPYSDCGTVPEGLTLDWKRYQSAMVAEFFRHEAGVLREVTPDVPLTTNLMGWFEGLDYEAFADACDVIAWDSYPPVGGDPAAVAAVHAMMRGLKGGRPWLLMEQTPSATNWQEYPTLKPPGLMRLWSWQAVAAGSDSAMYFQWRRSRGGHEKFHGAVVAHVGTEAPRVFGEVAALGDELARTGDRIVGTPPAPARIGVLWSQENRWALETSAGPGKDKRAVATAIKHFRAVWRSNLPADVVRMDADWRRYDLLIAPQLFMVRTGTYPLAPDPEAPDARGETIDRIDEAAKIAAFVERGGVFVATYLTGLVDESLLVHQGGYPGPLRELLGVWAEEIDVRPPGTAPNEVRLEPGAGLDLPRSAYACDRVFDLVHAEGAEVLARYGTNWYAGRPCLTVHRAGNGRAYYLATDLEDDGLRDLYRHLAATCDIQPLLAPVEGVEVLERRADDRRLIFLLNHGKVAARVDLGETRGTDLLTGEALAGTVELEPYGVRILDAADA